MTTNSTSSDESNEHGQGAAFGAVVERSSKVPKLLDDVDVSESLNRAATNIGGSTSASTAPSSSTDDDDDDDIDQE